MRSTMHKGFIIVDKDAIDNETKLQLEELGYTVIRKQPGREVTIFPVAWAV